MGLFAHKKWACACITLAWTASTWGQSAPGTPADAEASAAGADHAPDGYDALVDGGLEAFAQQRWSDAYGLFDRAHALHPNARTLRARGVASYMQGHLLAARKDLRAALEEPRRQLTPELIAAVRDLIARAEQRLAQLHLQVRPATARVELDGEVAEPEPGGVLFVSEGAHRLRLSAEAHAPLERDIVVRPGSVTDIVIELPPLAAIDEPGATRALDPAVALKRPAPKAATLGGGEPAGTSSTVGLWIAAGAGALFAVGAAGFWAAGDAEVDRVTNDCQKLHCGDEQRERLIAESDIETYEALTTTSLALSGASLAAFGLVYFLRQSSGETAPAIALRPTRAGIGVRF